MKWLVAILLVGILVFPSSASAAEKRGGAARLVLLPVSGPFTQGEKLQLAIKLASLLGEKYDLVYGGKVEKFLQKALREENQKADCDLDACYARVAKHFNAELVAALTVSKKQGNDYAVAFNIVNVLEGKSIFAKSGECLSCSIGKLVGLCDVLIPAGE